MTLLFIITIIFAFFAQSLIGFGAGLIAVPILSLFMPIQDAVTVLILFQLLMGLMIVKTHKQTTWSDIRALIPGMLIGVILGVISLKYLNPDVIRLVLAAYITVHLLRQNTSFDPLKAIIERGGAGFAGFLGGALNGMIGGGGPAFILYLKESMPSPAVLRANATAILAISNIPRLVGAFSTNMMTFDLLTLALYATPGFLFALFLGQKLHDKIPHKAFFIAVDVVLICTVASLLLKVAL